MQSNTTETDVESELTDISRDSIRTAVLQYDRVELDDSADSPLSVTNRSTRTDRYDREVDVFEVIVAITGRLDLDEVMDSQGRLMFCKRGTEIMLEGFEDGGIVVSVEQIPKEQRVYTDDVHPIFECNGLTVEIAGQREVEFELKDDSEVDPDSYPIRQDAEVDCVTTDNSGSPVMQGKFLLEVEQERFDAEPTVSLYSLRESKYGIRHDEIEVTDFSV